MIPVERTVKVHFSFHLPCESVCHFHVKQAHGAKSPLVLYDMENEIWLGNMTGSKRRKALLHLAMWRHPGKLLFKVTEKLPSK